MPPSQNVDEHTASLFAECREAIKWILDRPRVTEADVAGALGYTTATFARVRSELERDEPSPFVGEKLGLRVSSLVKLLSATAPAASRRERVRHYVDRIVQEIDSLPSGSMYTLVYVPPPLETAYERVCVAVARAAKNKVQFRYYYPAGTYYSDVVNRFMYPPDRPSLDKIVADEHEREQIPASMDRDLSRVIAFRGAFSWMADAEDKTARLKKDLMLAARLLDQEHRSHREINGEWRGEHAEAAYEHIIFRPLKVVPLPFNVKIVWKTWPDSAGRLCHEIRDETLTPDPESESRSIYDLDQIWTTEPGKLTRDALAAIIRLACDRVASTGRLVDERLPRNVLSPMGASSI